MTPTLWTITLLLLGSAVVLVALTFAPRARAASVARLGRSVGLAVPEGHEATLAARAARRTRATAIGAAIGTAVVVLALVTGVIPASDPDSDVSDIWLLLGGWFVGLAVGAMVNALTDKPTVVIGERFARASAVDLRDYLAPIDRVGARTSVAVGVLALGGASLLVASGFIRPIAALTVSAIVVGLGVASLVLFEIASRRILERPQPAGSPTELAWDDAMRAQHVRDMATAPISLGLWGALVVLLTLLDQYIPMTGAGGLLFGLLMVAVAALLALALAAAVFSIATKPQQHYLRRLWPTVAADLARPAAR